jgi:signal transduction histidine kinase
MAKRKRKNRHDEFLETLRRRTPVTLMTDYLEAQADVWANDGIEEEFVACCEAISNLIKAAKTKSVIDKLKDRLWEARVVKPTTGADSAFVEYLKPSKSVSEKFRQRW